MSPEHIVAGLLDDLPEGVVLTKPYREEVSETIVMLADGNLRGWIMALLEVAQERPATARAAADNLLDNLEPVVAEAARLLLQWQH